MLDLPAKRRSDWVRPLAVFVLVVLIQLLLVAVAGTDIPFYDQWGIEGSWLYPAWREGSLHAVDFLRPLNEHRMLWTHLLNLGLFVLNGQWDPLVQLAAIAVLRGVCAATLVRLASAGLPARGQWFVALGVAGGFLPHLAWHNVLWGIESHAYFVLGFSLVAMALLGATDRTPLQTSLGLAAGVASLLAMGPGAFVPFSLLGLVMLTAVEFRRFDRTIWRQAWPALILLGAALALRGSVPEHAALKAASWSQFIFAAGHVLAWPHFGQPLVALPMNLPLLLVVGGRVFHRRVQVRGENFVLLAAGWSLAVALATAWIRGGSDELATGVPSRYVDFLVLLPLANFWCTVVLAREASPRWRDGGMTVAVAWGFFLFVGWLGLSAQMMRHIILPRARDRDAPVRLIQEYQRTWDTGGFTGQPRLLVPHPNLLAVRSVLQDPRLQGVLPPSLQPDRPMGPLSRGVRWMLGR